MNDIERMRKLISIASQAYDKNDINFLIERAKDIGVVLTEEHAQMIIDHWEEHK